MTLLLEFWLQYWPWIGFGALVAVLLALDLFVFHRKAHVPTLRESAWWTAFWCSLALVFNGFVWWWKGDVPAQEFLGGYLLEWMLSMDNVFVFAVIFRFFHVPIQFQYRVLFWGILGAIFLRLTFILVGAALIARFHWVLPVFGVFLVYTAIKLVTAHGAEVHPDRNILMRIARRFVRVSRGDHRVHADHFFVRENGLLCVTPLFLVLLVVESTDVLFAVDSIPAIFGIFQDPNAQHVPFIVFTSNIFAILGLRALYFLLAGAMEIFRYLAYGLSAVLGFIGCGMIAEYAYETWFAAEGDHGHLIPIWLKLAVIVAALGFAIGLSVAANRRDERDRLNGVDPSHADSEDQPRG